MKRLISFFVTTAIILTVCASCRAEDAQTSVSDDFTLVMQVDNPVMTVNGTGAEIDEGRGTSPVIVNNRTLVPIRAIIEAMGGTVSWNQAAKTASLSLGGDTIDLTIDSTRAYLNGTAKELDTAPTIINDRTMLPIRFIAESFGFDVEWEQSTKTITVTRSESVGAPLPDESGKILVAYFTVPETDDVDAVASASSVVENGEVVGNVEFIAETVAEETNADIFRIETVQEYPGTHQALLEFAAEEGDKNARPELKTSIDNLDNYDTIFIGYPIWNADLPMPMYTFFDTYDFGGKTIIPFTAHGGSGFAGTIGTIEELEPDAEVENDGFSVSRNGVSGAKADIISWIQGLGLTAAVDTSTDTSVLVAYFSYTGNTREVAEYIQEKTGADIFEIVPKEAYTSDSLAERAQSEKNNNLRPKIQTPLPDITRYDTIFIGYPIWYYDAPMVIATFLESCDLTGKTVIPFCTSASSNIDVSMDLIREAAGSADIREGLTANGGTDETDAWLSDLKTAK